MATWDLPGMFNGRYENAFISLVVVDDVVVGVCGEGHRGQELNV